jgi:hypothetical protein
MVALKLERENSNIVNIGNDQRACECNTYLFVDNKRETLTVSDIIETDNAVIVKWSNNEYGEIEQRWYLTEGEEGDLNGSFEVKVAPSKDFKAIIIQDYAFASKEMPYFMIPGSLYGTNNIKNSKSLQPQLNYRGDIKYPKTPVIRNRADRSTHNAVMSIYNNNILALRIDEDTIEGDNRYYNGLGVDTRNIDAYDRISVTLGYHHFPVRYIGKLGPEHSHTAEQEYGFIDFTAGKQYNTKGHIYFGNSSNRYSYEKALQFFYKEIHCAPKNKVNRKEAIEAIAGALIKDAYNKEHKYFPTVLSGKFADTNFSGDTAWTGGMQVAYPLIKSSKVVPEALVTALDYIDNLVTKGVNEATGFFYESNHNGNWMVSGWWKHDLHLYNNKLEKLSEAFSAYVNGQAVCYMLKSYRYLKDNNMTHEGAELWLAACRRIIDNVIEQMRYDGALGVYYDPADGEAVYYNSFQGAWFLAAIAEIAAVTNEEKYIKAFKASMSFYKKFLDKVELWGMPMDTRDAVDEEGNLAYITALKTMHELTSEKEYMKQLIHAMHYEFSWKFAYNTRHVNEPLKSLNWYSCGGSITSSHNIHIHQMGNLIAEEMYYAYKFTGDEYILNRLRDTLNWGLGTFNLEDGYFGFGKKGWATEQFFHSDGIQDDPRRINDGGIWPDYLSWAASCVLLSTSEDIPDEFYSV